MGFATRVSYGRCTTAVMLHVVSVTCRGMTPLYILFLHSIVDQTHQITLRLTIKKATDDEEMDHNVPCSHAVYSRIRYIGQVL
jgi:hypothetical protein